jgi:gas vesicle protein
MARNNSGRKWALGALIAGVAGYVGGILTAPKSGKETREDITDKAVDIKNDTRVELENLQDDISDLLAKAKAKAESLSSQAREEINEAVLRAKEVQAKTSIVLRAVKTGEAEDPQLNTAVKQAKQAKKNLSRYLKS